MSEQQGSPDGGNPNLPTGTVTPGAAPEWVGKLDEPTKGLLGTKGWVDPDPVVALTKMSQGYANLEKRIGAKGVLLPGDKATAEEVAEFRKAIGVPESPDKYEFQLPQEADQNLVSWARTAFHKHGVSGKAAQGLLADWEPFVADMQKQALEADTQAKNEAIENLKKEWGGDYKPAVEMANKAMRALGLKTDDLNALDNLSADQLAGVRILSKIAKDYKIGVEDDVRGGGDPALVADAQAKLKSFEASERWLKAGFDRAHPEHDAVLKERRALYDAAFPGTHRRPGVAA